MKIVMSEVTAAKTSIESSKTKLQSQINSAKSSWKGVVSSDGLSGSVKLAIDAEINNYQMPLLTNYYDAMHQLSTEFTKAISDFKSTVKETSGSAIIDTDALTTAESKFSDQLTKFTEIEAKFKTVYSSISDLVSVSEVSGSGFTEEMEKTKKVLTNTKTWMATFNGKKSSKAISSVLSQQKAQIRSLKGVAGLSYTDPKSLEIYQNKAFKNKVSKQHKAVKKFEKEQLEAQRREIMRMHPCMAALDGNLTKADLDKIYKELNKWNGMKNSFLKNEWAQRVKNLTSFLASDFNVSVAAKLNSKGKKVSKYGNWGLVTNEYLRQDWRDAKKWLRKKDWKWVEKSGVLNNSFNRNIKQFKYKLKLDKLGKYAGKLDKVTGYVSAPIKKGLKKGSEVLSKTKYAGKLANNLGWAAMALDAGFSAHKAYNDPESSAYKDPGKAVIHAGVDQLKSAGPLEGAMAGAKIGSIVPGGAAIGAGIGFVAGGLNTIWGIVDPKSKDKMYKKAEDGLSNAYDGVKKTAKNIGKGISKAWNNVTSCFNKNLAYA